MGESKFLFHRLDCFLELPHIRATGGKFLLKVGDFGIPDCSSGFIPALPKGKTVNSRLGVPLMDKLRQVMGDPGTVTILTPKTFQRGRVITHLAKDSRLRVR